jgi:hypothetical protein
VRFTALFGDDNYVDGMQQLRSTLEESGYTMKQPPPDVNDRKGGWALGPYRGLNMVFTQNGFAFELLAHTQKSLKVAELNHPLYNVSRSDDGQIAEMMADTGPKGDLAKPASTPPACHPPNTARASTTR